MSELLDEVPWPPFINATEDPEETLSRLVHEYKHPIAAIQGWVTLILKGKTDPQEAARTIHRWTEHMQFCQDAALAYLQARGKLNRLIIASRLPKHLSKQILEILDALASEIEGALEDNLLGIYLRGSLATNDILETSDIDVLVVTGRPVNDSEFSELEELHSRISALPNAYANRIEIAYIDRAALRRFQPGLRHPTLGQGEQLAWSEHHDNWILERWTVREFGIALRGPDPKTLIDPISTKAIIETVRHRLDDWVEWANDVDDPDWRLPRSHKAYVVETMCRALYTLTCGTLPSKVQAVAWALETLPEPWLTLVKCSQVWRTDDTVDLAINPQIRQFVLWVASCPQLD